MSDYKSKEKKQSYNLSQLLAEVIAYEKEKAMQNTCGMSTVEAVKDIARYGIMHAGIVSHICTLPTGHTGLCKCCGYEWKGFK